METSLPWLFASVNRGKNGWSYYFWEALLNSQRRKDKHFSTAQFGGQTECMD